MAEERFFMDHGMWHDRVTGQHLYTQDQYDAVQRQLLEAQATADNLARALRKEIEPPTFMGEPVTTGAAVGATDDEAYRQFQRDRIAEAQKHDAEQAKPKLTDGVEGRPVTAQEDRWLRDAAKRSSTLVAPGKLADGVGASDEAQAHDARRYRFLRDAAHPDTNGGLRCVGNCADGGQPLHISGRDLDRAVDAAAAGNVVDPTACPECIGMGCEACNGTGDAPTMKAKCDGNHGGPRCADPECWNDDSVGAMSGPASLTELRRLIADDAYAMTFQTFGQYRSALLKAAYTITAHGVKEDQRG